MLKRLIVLPVLVLFGFGLAACKEATTTSVITTAQPTTTNVTTTSGVPTTTLQSGSFIYTPSQIRTFGSGTPAGTVNYDAINDQAVIWNIDASLDNYGGIQTPMLTLDFSKAVIFQMEVVDVYSEYIVKLAVQGESEYYYVLSDAPTLGFVSVNVVDAMLSTKYQTRNTQPDPGYATGWKYADQIKNCSFHILAKGPDGEQQTAELVIKSIAIHNNQTALRSLAIVSGAIEAGTIARLKGADPISLTTAFDPAEGFDDAIIWSSDDESIATVSPEGLLNFVGVGRTSIRATALIDQSKSDAISVDVLSGYEDPIDLKIRLAELTYDESETDYSAFMDLFQTIWGTDIIQDVTVPSHLFIDHLQQPDTLFLYNYFDFADADHLALAQSELTGTHANITLGLTPSPAMVYGAIGGNLYKYTDTTNLLIAYAGGTDHLVKYGTYTGQLIIVHENGDVKKLQIEMVASTLVADYQPTDFLNTALWTIPDRTLQGQNPVVHQLSPALAWIDAGKLRLKQNKYPEAKYCFGGIVSNIYEVPSGKDVELIIDVSDLNQMNDFVRTMWELKIIYYHTDGATVVSANPLKLASGNTSGTHTHVFTPAYTDFRIYLVVNGSDIGAQFADAEMAVASLKLQVLD